MQWNVKALLKNTLTLYFPFSQNCLFNVVMYNLTFSTSVSISGFSSLPKLPSHNSNCLQNSCYCSKSLRCNISVRLSFLQNHFLLSYFHWGTMILSVTLVQIISSILDSVPSFLPNNSMYPLNFYLINCSSSEFINSSHVDLGTHCSCNFFSINLHFLASQSSWQSLTLFQC